MKEHNRNLSLRLYACLVAALAEAVGREFMYYKCKDFPTSDNSHYNISCDAGRVIIVDSAIVGATDSFNPPQQCPITNNTCLKDITIAADVCTGRNSCDINQNIKIVEEFKLPCSLSNNNVANLININYTCIFPEPANYGDICHFDGQLYSNSVVYISSNPNFPDVIGMTAGYQCSCLMTSMSSTSSANVSIRALLVKLTGAATCSERLSIIDSKGDNQVTFCSPSINTKNATTVPLTSDPVEILFQRALDVSPYNGKFILEIKVPSTSTGSVGSINCSVVNSTISRPTTASSSYTLTTTTPSDVHNTTSGINLGLSNMPTSAELSTLSSSTPSSESYETQSNQLVTYSISRSATSSSTATQIGDRGPTDAGNKSLSTGGIIGIVLGSVGLIVIVVIVLVCLLRRRRQHDKGVTNFNVNQSLTVIQNLQTICNSNSNDATSSELYTFQSTAQQRTRKPQTNGNGSSCQMKDDSMSNYEDGAPVSDVTYGPRMISSDEERRRFNGGIRDDLKEGSRSMDSGDDDVTLVENQLYCESAKPVTNVVASDVYDVARPVVQDYAYDAATPFVQDNVYDAATPVVQDNVYDAATPVESQKVDNQNAIESKKNSSADHSYYNVPAGKGNGTVQSPTEVSAETETNIPISEEANHKFKADSEVVLIDNTLYGSMLTFEKD